MIAKNLKAFGQLHAYRGSDIDTQPSASLPLVILFRFFVSLSLSFFLGPSLCICLTSSLLLFSLVVVSFVVVVGGGSSCVFSPSVIDTSAKSCFGL